MHLNKLLTTHNNPLPEITTEGIFDLSKFSNFFTGFISKVLSIFDTKALIAIPVSSPAVQEAVKLINARSTFDLGNFSIITPEYISGAIYPYLETLYEVAIALSSIEERLLKPIETWAISMLTIPGYVDKLWLNLPINDNRVDSYTEKLHQYFNESVGDGVATRKFADVYVNGAGLEAASLLIDKLAALSTQLLNGKLSTKAANVAELIHQLSTRTDVANQLSTLPEEKMHPIADLVIQNSRELELLAIVLFNIKTASYAHSETLLKINNQLK